MSTKEYSSRHLAHLGQAQVVELMRRYYDGEKVSLLLAEYRLDCPQGKLYSLFPPQVLDDQRCPSCGGVMILPRVSRTYGSARSVRPKCAECRHVETPSCLCAHCANLRAEAAAEKTKYVQESIKAYCHGWHTAQRTLMPGWISYVQ